MNIKTVNYKGIYISEFTNGDITITANGHMITLENETIESVKEHINQGNIKLI